MNTSSTGGAGFDYNVVSEYESIDQLELSYSLTPSSPGPTTAVVSGFPNDPTPAAPWPAQTNPLKIETLLILDTSPAPQTLTSITNKIYKSPAPLPLAGAALGFGFCRKLRRRVLRVSGGKRPG